jgi:hypothetical protein
MTLLEITRNKTVICRYSVTIAGFHLFQPLTKKRAPIVENGWN